MDERLARSVLLRRKAESKRQKRGASPEVFASATCTQTVPRNHRPKLAKRGIRESPLLPSRSVVYGGGARQAVLAATDAEKNSNDEDDFAASLVYRKPTKKEEKGKSEDGGSTKTINKVRGGDHNLNDSNELTGLRDMSYWRDSENHLLPMRPQKNMPKSDSASPYSSISMGRRRSVHERRSPSQADLGSTCRQSFPTTSGLGEQ